MPGHDDFMDDYIAYKIELLPVKRTLKYYKKFLF